MKYEIKYLDGISEIVEGDGFIYANGMVNVWSVSKTNLVFAVPQSQCKRIKKVEVKNEVDIIPKEFQLVLDGLAVRIIKRPELFSYWVDMMRAMEHKAGTEGYFIAALGTIQKIAITANCSGSLGNIITALEDYQGNNIYYTRYLARELRTMINKNVVGENKI